jgi:hypothetical protein
MNEEIKPTRPRRCQPSGNRCQRSLTMLLSGDELPSMAPFRSRVRPKEQGPIRAAITSHLFWKGLVGTRGIVWPIPVQEFPFIYSCEHDELCPAVVGDVSYLHFRFAGRDVRVFSSPRSKRGK